MKSPAFPSKGDEGGEKTKEWEKEVKRLKTIVDYLEEEQKNNPSQSNKDKLDKAKDKLKDLESNTPQSSKNTPKNNSFFSQSLIVGGVILLLAISGIGFLIYKAKKKNS